MITQVLNMASKIFSTVFKDGSKILINLHNVSRVQILKSNPKRLYFFLGENNTTFGTFLFFTGGESTTYHIDYDDESIAIKNYEKVLNIYSGKEQLE